MSIWRRKTSEDPKVGEKWIFCGDAVNDPFGPKSGYSPVKILDVKDGWVRYYMGPIFNDERARVESFVSMYKKVA